MTNNNEKSGQVVDFNAASAKADSRRQEQREAKAKNLKKRFSASRRNAESKSTAAERLKNLFKNPGPKPPKKP